MSFIVVWEFEPQPERSGDFQRAYGPRGVWPPLFRQSADYLGTELLHDLDTPSRYFTIDRWTSREAYDRFRQERAAEYRAIDERCTPLTRRETFVGAFAVMP